MTYVTKDLPPVGSTGRLAELQVGPGDVVKCIESHYYTTNAIHVGDVFTVNKKGLVDAPQSATGTAAEWTLISRATPQAPHIITHEGRTYDLTALETPFGLLPEVVRDALKAWPHGWDMYRYGQWNKTQDPQFYESTSYRARPAPAETTHVLDFGTPDSFHTLTITYPGKSLPHGQYTGPDGARITVEGARPSCAPSGAGLPAPRPRTAPHAGVNCNSIQTAAQAASVGFAKGDDMSDELVKRLRGMEVITTPGQPFSLATAGPWLKHNDAMRREAAARIEALAAERDDQKIARLEAVKSWVNAEARVRELEGLVDRAKLLIDPCYPQKHADWQNDARATLTKKGPTDAE